MIFGVRSLTKGQAAVEKIYRDCAAYRGRIEVWELDMARFDSVLAFGTRCKADVPRLDIAILNAGIGSTRYRRTIDGWEEMLQVPYKVAAPSQT